MAGSPAKMVSVSENRCLNFLSYRNRYEPRVTRSRDEIEKSRVNQSHRWPDVWDGASSIALLLFSTWTALQYCLIEPKKKKKTALQYAFMHVHQRLMCGRLWIFPIWQGICQPSTLARWANCTDGTRNFKKEKIGQKWKIFFVLCQYKRLRICYPLICIVKIMIMLLFLIVLVVWIVLKMF